MNKLMRFCTAWLVLPFMLTGCWNKLELTERAFVQAVAIDAIGDNNIQLTTLFYKPGGGTLSEGAAAAGGYNVTTQGSNLSDAMDKITSLLGRLSQWSHMRTLLISEKLASEQQLRSVIDHFMRDHEAREYVLVIITKGTASQYLQGKPFVENTMGQQLREMNYYTTRFTGKSRQSDMLQTSIQLKSQSGIAILPYMYMSSEDSSKAAIDGLAVLKNGIYVNNAIPISFTRYLLMMRNEYKRGVLGFPCQGQTEGKQNSFDHVAIRSSMKVTPSKETVKVQIHLMLEGNYGGLYCSKVVTPQDEEKVIKDIRNMLEAELSKTVALIKNKKLDLLQLGDHLYRHHPALWKKWKPTWDQRLADASFNFQIDIRIINTGLIKAKPLGG
ncbi:MAG: Ger(x)C family spore germination protein [Paenibacillus sp.]|nr:Ger(x)C family spore germination protein [Paenibacillus sp.]